MPDSSKDKRGKQQSQLEQDAQTLHEKTARLREMRLAHEAATGVVEAGAAVPAGRKEVGQIRSVEVEVRQVARTGVRLPTGSTTQEDQGRRS